MNDYHRFWLDRALEKAYFEESVCKFNEIIAPYIDELVALGELTPDGDCYVLTDVGRERCLRMFYEHMEAQRAVPDSEADHERD